jgi:hypothetical protein
MNVYSTQIRISSKIKIRKDYPESTMHHPAAGKAGLKRHL